MNSVSFAFVAFMTLMTLMALMALAFMAFMAFMAFTAFNHPPGIARTPPPVQSFELAVARHALNHS